MSKEHIGGDLDDFRGEEDLLEALGRQGDRAAFDRVLVKIPAAPPDPWDRWGGPDVTRPGKERA